MAEAPAKEYSAEIKDLADKIVNLSVKDAQNLVDCLKDEHGIEPAGGGAVMMAGPAGGGEGEAAEEKTSFDVMLREVFPIESYDGTMFLDYISYELEEPRYTADECRELRLTYGLPFKIRVRLRRETHPDLPEEDIYLGEFPVLMGGGEFIVNGAERVIVSQLHRSPGVDFSIVSSEADRPLHSARIIPERGSWIELEVTKKDVLAMRIDQSTKLAATTFLRCLDESVASTDAIISLFYEVSEVKAADVRPEDYAAASIIDTESGEELVHEGRMIGEESAEAIQNSSDQDGQGRPEPVGHADPQHDRRGEARADRRRDSDHARALLKVYGKLRPGNPPQVDKAMQLFQEKFFDDNRYRLGRVGRFRINRKFNLDVPEDQMFIRGEDFLRVIQYILDLRSTASIRRRAGRWRRSTTSTTWATGASGRSTSSRSRSCARAS
jgi:DNA-directed RNA polymerase subunit beta